jgi:hypothetical protein
MGWPKPDTPKTFSYRAPVTDKPPAPISHLGRVVAVLAKAESLTSREVFVLAFAPHENFDCCKASLVTAKARGYVERKDKSYALTDKGAAVFRAIEAMRRK